MGVIFESAAMQLQLFLEDLSNIMDLAAKNYFRSSIINSNIRVYLSEILKFAKKRRGRPLRSCLAVTILKVTEN